MSNPLEAPRSTTVEIKSGSIIIKDDITSGVFITEKFDSDHGVDVTINQIKVSTTKELGGYETIVEVLSFDENGKTEILAHDRLYSKDYDSADNVHWRALNGLNPTNSAEFIYVPFNTIVKRIPNEGLGKNIDAKRQVPASTNKDQLVSEEPRKESKNSTPAKIKEPADSPPKQPERGSAEGSESANPQPNNESSYFDQVEKGITGFFGDAKKDSASLKKSLEEYADGGGNWMLAALGTTALDIADVTMNVAEGLPLGILDIRNLGEGVGKGTWEGAKEDARRLLAIVPASRTAQAVSLAITTSDVNESIGMQNYQAAGEQIVTAVAGGKRGEGKKRKRLGRKPPAKDYQYLKGTEIEGAVFTWKQWTKITGGRGGMEGHHVFLKQFLRNARSQKLKDLEDYVPTMAMTRGRKAAKLEHDTAHSFLDPALKEVNLYRTRADVASNRTYTKTEIKQAAKIMLKEYRRHADPEGPLVRSLEEFINNFLG